MASRLISGFLRRLGGLLPVVELDGQRLDPDTRAMLVAYKLFPTLDSQRPERARASLARSARLVAPDRVDLPEVRDLVGPCPMRLYRPGPGTSGLLFFHGGGFVVGDLDSHDAICRVLAQRSGRTIVAVDYRLAPEHPFPAALEDALASWRWFVAQAPELGLDPEGLAIAGESAGAMLSTLVCQGLGDGEQAPERQVLIYPGADRSGRAETRSRELFGQGFLLTNRLTDWFLAHYTQEADPADPRISPMFGPLEGQPPAWILTAGFDPLRDEGEEYARRLEGAGVPVRLDREESLVHGFLQIAGASRASMRTLERIGDGLVARMSPSADPGRATQSACVASSDSSGLSLPPPG